MHSAEKIYSIFGILYVCVFLCALVFYPKIRQLQILLPLSLAGMIINIGLMFVVLKDLFYRNFVNPMTKYIWIGAILIFWPSVLYYLPKYGFNKR